MESARGVGRNVANVEADAAAVQDIQFEVLYHPRTVTALIVAILLLVIATLHFNSVNKQLHLDNSVETRRDVEGSKNHATDAGGSIANVAVDVSSKNIAVGGKKSSVPVEPWRKNINETSLQNFKRGVVAAFCMFMLLSD